MLSSTGLEPLKFGTLALGELSLADEAILLLLWP